MGMYSIDGTKVHRICAIYLRFYELIYNWDNRFSIIVVRAVVLVRTA